MRPAWSRSEAKASVPSADHAGSESVPLPPVAWLQVPSDSTVQMWLSGRLPFSAYAALTENATCSPSGETATAPGRRSSRNCAASSRVRAFSSTAIYRSLLSGG